MSKQIIKDALNSAANRYDTFLKKYNHEEALENAFAYFESEMDFYEIILDSEKNEEYRLILEKKVVITELPDAQTLTRRNLKWYNKEEWIDKMPRWDRYKELKRGELPEKVIEAIDSKTDNILQLIQDPRESLDSGNHFDSRGLVVGYVQSGKTGNYTGLINKAIDVGYRYVIVLAGMHDNLRSQTQERIDEGVVGTIKRDNVQTNIGIGLNKNWIADTKPMTFFDNDFGKNAVNFDLLNSDVRIWVVKKNKSILNNVNQFLENLIESNINSDFVNVDEKGIKRLNKIPMLVIDDEADQASINTKVQPLDEDGKVLEEFDPTAINQGIRVLLNKFTAKSYVGYTATPFANIFIQNKPSPKYGDDLFPRDFIVMMQQPSNYVGALEVFGGLSPDDKGLPITRDIFDYSDSDLQIKHVWGGKDKLKGKNSLEKIYKERITDIIHWNGLMPSSGKINDIKITTGDEILVGEGFMPGKHDKTHNPKKYLKKKRVDLPLSLKHAIASFILGCSIRIMRGQEKKHMSMLIHITRFTAVQKLLTDVVLAYCKKMFREIENNDIETMLWLENIYNEDFLKTARLMQLNADVNKEYYHGMKYKLTDIDHSWDDVLEFIPKAIKKMMGPGRRPNVRQISGGSKDLLDYYKYKSEGLSVIAIGGDKLSRGLTLEGLMVSYYLRLSAAYDTLMQMGRWFGYRDGFVDTCRIYANNELLRNYSHIAIAFEELRGLFEEMAAEDPQAAPEEFGLQVQNHPSMIITNVMKMKTVKKLDLDFSGKMSETIVFWNQADKIENNINATEKLISDIGNRSKDLEKDRRGIFAWSNVEACHILDFLGAYENHPTSKKMITEVIIDYIKKANNLSSPELINWTVILFGKQNGDEINIGDLNIIPSERGFRDLSSDKISIGVITGNKEQEYDFSEVEINSLKEKWNLYKVSRESEGKKYLSFHRWLRIEQRQKENGILILYPITIDFNKQHKNRVKYSSAKGDYLMGFAIVTPTTKSSIKTNYVLNEIAAAEFFDANN